MPSWLFWLIVYVIVMACIGIGLWQLMENNNFIDELFSHLLYGQILLAIVFMIPTIICVRFIFSGLPEKHSGDNLPVAYEAFKNDDDYICKHNKKIDFGQRNKRDYIQVTPVIFGKTKISYVTYSEPKKSKREKIEEKTREYLFKKY